MDKNTVVTARVREYVDNEYEVYFDGELAFFINFNDFYDFENMLKVPIIIMRECITKKDLIDKLNEIDNNGDKESNHGLADDLLIDYINDADIYKAYGRINKWYA